MKQVRKILLAALLLLAAFVLFAGCSAQPTIANQSNVVTSPVPTTSSNPIALNPTNVVPTNTSTLSAAAENTNVPPTLAPTDIPTAVPTPTTAPLNPLQIEYLRQRDYTGSDITIEQTLAPHANYNSYIVSYQSDGLKIYALLTVPTGKKPASGWPVIIFNHGFIPPTQYRTTERYVAYVDALARSGYIVLKSDYRGHGDSEGEATGGYGSPAYTIDVLNAIASIKRYPDADVNRIGMWGHSMGGQVTLRAMVVSHDIKAGVIWSGVVGTYTDLMYNWHQPSAQLQQIPLRTRRWRQDLIDQYGTPEQNPEFWASISPNTYVADLTAPLQLHHDTGDSEVPLKFSQELYDQVKQVGKSVELYTYAGDDHNIAQNFGLAMQRTIAFFDKYVSQSE